MWQILINGPGYFDTQYNLPEGDTHLGRADENDVVLTGDKVSRRHARLRISASQITVEDLGSRNGTQVNGKNISAQVVLASGDQVAVGENTLTLRQPDEVEVARTEMVSDDKIEKLDEHLAALAGQVVMSRDLTQNSFLASFDTDAPLTLNDLSKPKPDEHEIERRSLALLYKVVDALSRAPSLDAFLQEVLDLVMELSEAATGVVLLKNAKGTFSPVVVRHPAQLNKGEVPISDGIVAEVVQKRVALAVADAADDQRFSGRESVIMYDVNQVLCVPMVHDGGIIGLIYLNRSSGKPGNLAQLLDLLTAIAQLSANGAQQARLKAKAQNEEKVRRALERFHAPDVVDRVVKELGKGGVVGQKVEEKLVTVVVADISGFTALAQKHGPKIADLLNEFYRRMSRVVFSFGGTVDKFVGDSVQSVFGAPYDKPDDVIRAVRCALAMRREFIELMQGRPASEKCQVRVAAATGKALVGIVGSDARMEYATLGDPVTLARAIEVSAAPGQVLLSKSTVEAVGRRFKTVALPERALRGMAQKQVVYELQDEELNWATSPGL
jgi:class 3 adenylate cyclase